MAGKFVIRTTNTGVKFDLQAANGEVIATSEVYSSMTGCRNGVECVRANAARASMEDQTVEGYAAQRHPKFVVYLDAAGQYRFQITLCAPIRQRKKSKGASRHLLFSPQDRLMPE